MRFLIKYKVGDSMRTNVIEAKNLDDAEIKTNQLHAHWDEIRYQNTRNLGEVNNDN